MIRNLAAWVLSLALYPLSYRDRAVCAWPNLTDSEDQW